MELYSAFRIPVHVFGEDHPEDLFVTVNGLLQDMEQGLGVSRTSNDPGVRMGTSLLRVELGCYTLLCFSTVSEVPTHTAAITQAPEAILIAHPASHPEPRFFPLTFFLNLRT